MLVLGVRVLTCLGAAWAGCEAGVAVDGGEECFWDAYDGAVLVVFDVLSGGVGYDVQLELRGGKSEEWRQCSVWRRLGRDVRCRLIGPRNAEEIFI